MLQLEDDVPHLTGDHEKDVQVEERQDATDIGSMAPKVRAINDHLGSRISLISVQGRRSVKRPSKIMSITLQDRETLTAVGELVTKVTGHMVSQGFDSEEIRALMFHDGLVKNRETHQSNKKKGKS